MAAGITANEEQLDLHKIDGSGVVSKYVGETEKNLSQIFLKPWPKNLMLLIAGADVLMGKRSTVRNARDLHGGRHEKRMLVQNGLEIHRATGQSASMPHLARLAGKLAKDPSLRQRFENLKGVWDGTF